eukprot:362592-Pyramimonas_sp.AAC.1
MIRGRGGGEGEQGGVEKGEGGMVQGAGGGGSEEGEALVVDLTAPPKGRSACLPSTGIPFSLKTHNPYPKPYNPNPTPYNPNLRPPLRQATSCAGTRCTTRRLLSGRS